MERLLPRHRKLLFSLLEGYCHGELLDSMVAAHPRKPLVSETRGLRGWAATLPRAPAMVFFGNVGIGVLCTGIGVFLP